MKKGYGGHLVFQNEAKLCHRQVFDTWAEGDNKDRVIQFRKFYWSILVFWPPTTKTFIFFDKGVSLQKL